MSKVFPCPHCRAQNFATGARLRQAGRVPLRCWKCGEEAQTPRKRRGEEGVKNQGSGGKRRK